MPGLVPPEHFANAVTWGSTFWQITTIFGPSLGGVLYGATGGATWVYAACAGVLIVASLLAFAIRARPSQVDVEPVSWLASLLVLGASDMISVVVRSTVVQLRTPDAMRGRVSAVNMLFIAGSSELGELESGLTASWFGTVPAVVLGGVGTLVVVALYAYFFPELRAVDRLDTEGAA
jgi:hypothetical protein